MNLKKYRGRLTQQEVADDVGIKRASYAMIENGKRCPSVKTAKRIAQKLNFDWTLFFEENK